MTGTTFCVVDEIHAHPEIRSEGEMGLSVYLGYPFLKCEPASQRGDMWIVCVCLIHWPNITWVIHTFKTILPHYAAV